MVRTVRAGGRAALANQLSRESLGRRGPARMAMSATHCARNKVVEGFSTNRTHPAHNAAENFSKTQDAEDAHTRAGAEGARGFIIDHKRSGAVHPISSRSLVTRT